MRRESKLNYELSYLFEDLEAIKAFSEMILKHQGRVRERMFIICQEFKKETDNEPC